jgi:diguanylate cyclase (GGDEF)-like protein
MLGARFARLGTAFMKDSKTAKPSRRPVDVGRLRPKARGMPSRRSDGGEAAKHDAPQRHEATRSKTPSRAIVTRLAAEVDALAAELEASRARIVELEARIDIDPLTEIRNRRGFARELARSLAYVKRYGTSAVLIYVDLDGFKWVNDRHGHAAGDAVLKAVAATLVRHVRTSDVVARVGGDEFAVLLWNVGGATAAAKVAALEAAVYATPVRWNASTLAVGASAGMTALGALDTPAEVLARADAAMYARKAERKGGSASGIRQ